MSDKLKTKSIKVTKAIKNKANIAVIQKVYSVILNNMSAYKSNTKTRGLISGGGKKPWKQKGTGNARAGSSRSPLWRGGGITFGPIALKTRPKKINKKENIIALKQIIDLKKEKKLIHHIEFKFSKPKTAEALKLLKSLNIDSKTLVISAQVKPEIELSFSNISYVKTKNISNINITDLIKFKNIIFEEKAWKLFQEKYNV